ncbi:N-6 DNA methylase [uncultured Clostridium sp.]|uniref:N-6 DNA methylase n=1 Tax=uncultured Clostridium sp. TaxID=59620 RepID=UPI0025E33DD9|nr:N-6 DNA methylase [uncultured Clostridium sp.]
MSFSVKSIRKEFQSKGIFYTPKELAEYIKSFLPKDVKEVYDPTCGDGGLLGVFDDNVKKYGQEINQDQLEVARQNLVNFTGICGNTLKEPGFIDRKFDYIVANPPFSIEWEPEDSVIFHGAPTIPTKSKADYAFILHCLYMLGKGKAVIMEFPGVLYRGGREGQLRQWLVDNNYIEKIVSVPEKQFEDTSIATCIIVLSKNKTNTDVIFVDKETSQEKVVSFEEIKKNDYCLSVSRYIDTTPEKTKELEEFDPLEEVYSHREFLCRFIENAIKEEHLICSLHDDWYLRDLKEYLIEFIKNVNPED